MTLKTYRLEIEVIADDEDEAVDIVNTGLDGITVNSVDLVDETEEVFMEDGEDD